MHCFDRVVCEQVRWENVRFVSENGHRYRINAETNGGERIAATMIDLSVASKVLQPISARFSSVNVTYQDFTQSDAYDGQMIRTLGLDCVGFSVWNQIPRTFFPCKPSIPNESYD